MLSRILSFLYRVVSKHEISSRDIGHLFGYDAPNDAALKELGVSWVKRAVWPYTFKPFDGQRSLDDLQILPGLYYAGAGEDLVTSLELSCRMGRNAAELLYYDHMVGDPIP